MDKNLIDRYIAEIGKHLPARNRADIQKEIRSTLEDMLEDRASQAGRPPDEDLLVGLLRDYGRPEDVAATYLPERSLIGPRLYPLFSLVSWIALSVLAVVLLITAGLGVLTGGLTPQETLEAAVRMLTGVGASLLSAFGSIVITFAILERVFQAVERPGRKADSAAKGSAETDGKAGWNPRDLPEVAEVEKFSVPGLWTETAFTLVALLVFNLAPGIVGFAFQVNDRWTFLPVLSEAFYDYLPYLNALWGLQILFNLYLLWRGRWESTSRWLRMGLTALGILLAAVMLAGPDLIGATGEALAAVGPDFPAEAAAVLTWLPRISVRIALALAVILSGLDLVKSLAREIRTRTRS